MTEDRGTAEHGLNTADVADETIAWAVAGGIVTTVLFPFALPIIALTVVVALPLLLAPLAVGLAAAVVILPVLVVRGLVRRVIPALRSPGTVAHGRPA
jgi:hypothetical protein